MIQQKTTNVPQSEGPSDMPTNAHTLAPRDTEKSKNNDEVQVAKEHQGEAFDVPGNSSTMQPTQAAQDSTENAEAIPEVQEGTSEFPVPDASVPPYGPSEMVTPGERIQLPSPYADQSHVDIMERSNSEKSQREAAPSDASLQAWYQDGAAATTTNTTHTGTSEEGDKGSEHEHELQNMHMDYLRTEQSSDADTLEIDHGGDTSHQAETISGDPLSEQERTQRMKTVTH